MQIVINISEEDYLSMKDGHIPFNMLDVVMNGTPLSKEVELESYKKALGILYDYWFKKIFGIVPEPYNKEEE